MLAGVAQYFGVGGMIGVFDGDDGLSELRVLVAQIGGELLLGLRGTDQQNLMRTAQGLGDIIEKMVVGRRLVTAVSAFAAVNALMLIFGADLGLFLRGR